MKKYHKTHRLFLLVFLRLFGFLLPEQTSVPSLSDWMCRTACLPSAPLCSRRTWLSPRPASTGSIYPANKPIRQWTESVQAAQKQHHNSPAPSPGAQWAWQWSDTSTPTPSSKSPLPCAAVGPAWRCSSPSACSPEGGSKHLFTKGNSDCRWKWIDSVNHSQKIWFSISLVIVSQPSFTSSSCSTFHKLQVKALSCVNQPSVMSQRGT